MKAATVLAAAAGLAGYVSAHGHQHGHLHRRDTTSPTPSSTPCPVWTGGHRPPAYLTNLPLSVQAELPTWTGAPPPDWCSGTAWMQSYVSCATVYASCSAKSNATTTTSGNFTYTGSATSTGTGTYTGSTTATGTASSSWSGTGTWSSWGNYSSTPTGTWGSSADPTDTSTWSSWADPSSTSDDPTSTASTWGSWVDPSSTSADPATTASTWGSWSDPSSTSADPATTASTWGSWVDPSSTSADPATTASTWGSWADSSDTYADPGTTASTWGSWADPSGTYADPATTTSTWGSWVDPASASSSSTAWGTWGSSVDPAYTSSGSVCGCTTVIVTVTGDPTWIPDSATTTSVTSTTYTTVTVVPTETGWDTTTWGSWDPSTTSSSTTSWASWTDGASTSFYTSTTSDVAWSSPSAVPSGGSGNAAIAPAGSLWALTYSPYTSGGGCKDADTITADITAIKALGFTTVRIYSTDCSGLDYVGSAAKSVGLKLILGVFIEASGVSGAQPQVDEIVAWGQWDLVEMIIIGNEALFNNYLSVSDLTGFITSSKWAFSNAGYTGPITTTEPLDSWIQDGSSLCSSIDVVAANIHAFFNAQTDASQAGAFIESELAILGGICPGKPTYVVESGWPHAGQPNGAAIPGPSEQATALASIQSTCGSQVVFFTYEDDLWKAPGAFGVEQSWGCADVFKNGTSW